MPNAVLRNTKLTPRAKLAYVALKSFDWHGEGCHPSREAIAERMGCSARTADRAISELVEARLVEKRRRGLTQSNSYLLLTDVATPEWADVATQELTETTQEVDAVEVDQPVATTTAASTGEDALAAEILDAFNAKAGTTYRFADWRSMIVRRVRSHPDYSMNEWRRVLDSAFADAWWERRSNWRTGCRVLTPGVVFKSDRLIASYEQGAPRPRQRRYTALSEWEE